MTAGRLFVFGTGLLAAGCGLVHRAADGVHTVAERIRSRNDPPVPDAPYNQYHLNGFAWESVGRVLVLPVLNESQYPRAGEEMQAALASELQRLGRFEVIAAPADDQAVLTRQIHRAGRFDEGVLLDIGRETRADVVLHATLSQYSPYPRPRMGLVVQAVGPREGKVVASVDGLWDTTDAGIAEQVRTYYRQRPRPKPPFIRNHVIAPDDAFAAELALDSPALFQRYIAHVVANVLVGAEGVAGGGATNGTGPACPPASPPVSRGP